MSRPKYRQINGKTVKKIMFNDTYGLTAAVLEGRKTMTRRIIPKRIIDSILTDFRAAYYEDTLDVLGDKDCIEQYFLIDKVKNLPFKVGDVVAVAQKYEDICHGLSDREASWFIDTLHLRYDDKCALDLPAWRNKEFVLADLMPHRIRFTDVRIERLQDISDEDCLKEGIYETRHHSYGYPPSERQRTFRTKVYQRFDAFTSPRNAFAELFERVSKFKVWERNPWVVVYQFELVQ